MQESRSEHLQWCKDRAIEIVDSGDAQGAYASFLSDMQKHPETVSHQALALGMQLMMIGDLGTAEKMKKFINGFN